MRVTTWNVLHRIHAMNWEEGPAAAYPDERVRTRAIAERIAGWLAGDVDVVCLQEVSGDQLACLRSVVPESVHLFDHCYPRVPRLRRDVAAGAHVLDDATEHLVVLVKSLPASIRSAVTFASDPGKGLLAVDVGDDLLVVDTHVSWGPRAAAQLDELAKAALEARPVAAVMGDFNAALDVVAQGLGDAFAPAAIFGPTRLPSSGEGKTIDHVFVRGAGVRSAEVLDEAGLSDHRPVTAEVATNGA